MIHFKRQTMRLGLPVCIALTIATLSGCQESGLLEEADKDGREYVKCSLVTPNGKTWITQFVIDEKRGAASYLMIADLANPSDRGSGNLDLISLRDRVIMTEGAPGEGYKSHMEISRKDGKFTFNLQKDNKNLSSRTGKCQKDK
jgi:hypothetical protein